MKSTKGRPLEASNRSKSEVTPRLRAAQSVSRTRPPKRPMLQKATDADTIIFNDTLFYLDWQRKVMNYYANLIFKFYLLPLKSHLQSNMDAADSAEQRSLRLRLGTAEEQNKTLGLKSVAKLKTVTIAESAAVFRLTQCLRAMAAIESNTNELLEFLRNRPRKYIKPLCELKKFVDPLFQATCALSDVFDLPPVETNIGEAGGGDVEKPPHQMQSMELFVEERAKHTKPLLTRINYTRAFAHLAVKKLIGMVQLIVCRVPHEDLKNVTVKQLRIVRSSLPPRFLFVAEDTFVPETTKALLHEAFGDESGFESIEHSTRPSRRDHSTRSRSRGSTVRRSRSSKRHPSCPRATNTSSRCSSVPRSSSRTSRSRHKSSVAYSTNDSNLESPRTSGPIATSPSQRTSQRVSRRDRHEQSAQMKAIDDLTRPAVVAKKLAK